MKKLINDPDRVVEEMLEGLVAIHPGLQRLAGELVVIRADAEGVRARQVGLISGGGSGHEPAHAGYIGRGMLSAAVAGDVFTSPGPDAVFAAIRAVAGPRGALLIVKNYTGDRLNFGLAAERARAEGITVEMVVVADDVALAGGGGHAGRRGLAGTILVHKVAGAVAEAGASLAEVAAEARDAASAVRTMGVALTPCTVPAAGQPGFSLGEAEVELGLGIHGEPGVRRVPIEPADALVDRLMGPILAEIAGGRVVLLVNNLGGTPTMELAIVARHAIDVLERGGKRVERVYAGTFLSALEMAGVSLTVLPVDDQRLARLDAPTDAPAWPNAAAQPRLRSTTASPEPSPAPKPAAGAPRTAPGRRTRRRDRGGRPVVDRGRVSLDRAGSGRRRRRSGDQPDEGRAGHPGRLALLPTRRPGRDAARAGLDPATGPRRHVRPSLRDALASRRRLRAIERPRGRDDLGGSPPSGLRRDRRAGRSRRRRSDDARRPGPGLRGPRVGPARRPLADGGPE